MLIAELLHFKTMKQQTQEVQSGEINFVKVLSAMCEIWFKEAFTTVLIRTAGANTSARLVKSCSLD